MLQLVILLDVEDTLADASVLPLLPPARGRREVLRLSDHRPPQVWRQGAEASPVDWAGLALAVGHLAADVKARVRVASGEVELFLLGRAPLPLFTHLGFELSAWAPRITVINRRKLGPTDVVDVLALPGGPDGAESYFSPPFLPEAPSVTTGHIAVFISCGQPAPEATIRSGVQDQGRDLGAIIEMRPPSPGGAVVPLDAASFAAAAKELGDIFSVAPSRFPFARGFVLCVHGPVQLAFLAGRAINPNVVPEITVTNFHPASGYSACYELPWRGRSPIRLGRTPDDETDRVRVLRTIVDGLEELRSDLKEDDASRVLTTIERERLLRNLSELRFPRAPEGDGFRLSLLQSELTLGGGLLEALRTLDGDPVRDIGRLVTLHELFHAVCQGLYSTNYPDVGRAGVVLEEVDYWADVVSLETLARWRVRRGDLHGREVATAVAETIATAILGMRAFDRAEQGSPMVALPERRLRRYLIWHLQQERALTIRELDHASILFGERLAVELAPLEGYLDARFDKAVRWARPGAELFVGLKHSLIREREGGPVAPNALIEAVRNFESATLNATMRYVVQQHHARLASWARS